MLPQLVGIRFQVLFHSPPGVLFTFPSRYWYAIGRQRVFSLGGWSPQIPTGFLVSRRTWECRSGSAPHFAYRTITFFGKPFQTFRLYNAFVTSRARPQQHPATPAHVAMHPVWADPRSLAATSGISVDFFSSGYLDVSVHRVGFYCLCIQQQMVGRLIPPGFPIRTSPDQSLLAAPRGLSQLTTSFIAC